MECMLWLTMTQHLPMVPVRSAVGTAARISEQIKVRSQLLPSGLQRHVICMYHQDDWEELLLIWVLSPMRILRRRG